MQPIGKGGDCVMAQSTGTHLVRANIAHTRVIEKESKTPNGYVVRDLSPQEFKTWDALVDASAQSSVFSRTWWLKATCDDFCIRGLFNNGTLVAGIPLYFERRYGLRFSTMPRLTQTLGIVMERLQGKTSSAAGREIEILSALAQDLATLTTFFQAFHPSLTNWLPFYWAGFRQTTRITYVIDEPLDDKRLWDGLNHRVRGEITKAQKSGLVVEPCSVETVVQLESKTFTRQNLQLPHSPDMVRRIFLAAKQNNAGECFAVKDRDGRVHCAGLIVWDANRAYYLISGGDPTLRTSGATSLLAWHLIRFSRERARVFDFEGSMLRQVERLFRNFGATAVPYNFIYKCPLWLQSYLYFTHKL